MALVREANSSNISLSMVASAASERQPGGEYLDNISLFEARMIALGFGSIDLLKPIGKVGISFWGHSIYPDLKSSDRESEIFECLFPGHSSSWAEYAAHNNVDVEDLSSLAWRRWRNMLCDAQAYWAYEYYGIDFFVTSDDNFRRKLATLSNVAVGSIVTPQEAVARV